MLSTGSLSRPIVLPESSAVPSLIESLTRRGLLEPPAFLPANMQYETIMGSVAFGVSSDASDCDIYGFAMPPLEQLFPHLAGEIAGFGNPLSRFDNYHMHHVQDPEALNGQGCEYDFSIFSIQRYFTLCLVCNPNMIDSLFTADDCVVFQTNVARMVRERRRLFLHKGVLLRFKAYSNTQLNKLNSKQPLGKRKALQEKFGYDVKYGYHIVRLLYECEQLLQFADVDLRRDHEHLKAIRRGEVSEADLRAWAISKEKQLDELALRSPLPEEPNESAVRQLLRDCLEEHYGSLDSLFTRPASAGRALRQPVDIDLANHRPTASHTNATAVGQLSPPETSPPAQPRGKAGGGTE